VEDIEGEAGIGQGTGVEVPLPPPLEVTIVR
jgi:hypothetical protein